MNRRPRAFACLLLSACSVAAGTGRALAQSSLSDEIGNRIKQELSRPAPKPAVPSRALPSAAPVAADTPERIRVNHPRLPSPVDRERIDQRIDQGMQAAGADRALPDRAFGAFQRGYFLTAFSLALEKAKNGDAPSETLLGVLLSRGLGVKQDYKEAAGWLQLASDKGDHSAMYMLGEMYLAGQGVSKDPAKAADLIQKAADTGDPVALRELAFLLLQGEGRDKNPMLAAAYLRRAADAADTDAQFALAGMYMDGVGVAQDPSQAVRWFSEAARRGHVGAQVEYGIMLFNGTGAARDEAAGARWLMQAAAADNPVAQIRVARLLADGVGMKQNSFEAARWYLLARQRGLHDDYMDNFVLRLDKDTRQKAVEAVAHWTGGSVVDVAKTQNGNNPAQQSSAPVDKKSN
ncbi:hypothetical protein SAMN05216548_10131 [Faunimonas pinastri]|uniref:Sel1 repeat family protein n=1 Tax=Faunimonas pinastri TaxID=1855383 RepID=A0A1H8Z3T7_9HYPH|nr:tetratricopeptide repeat protein [Faunimonas pinastri]SEP59104.1 hypothetical protein SAMN05216548_10131 [Faunimonas pinastri]